MILQRQDIRISEILSLNTKKRGFYEIRHKKEVHGSKEIIIFHIAQKDMTYKSARTRAWAELGPTFIHDTWVRPRLYFLLRTWAVPGQAFFFSSRAGSGLRSSSRSALIEIFRLGPNPAGENHWPGPRRNQ